MSLRIIATTIILLWSIQTYKCNEGFKPGKKVCFQFILSFPNNNRCVFHNEKSFFLRLVAYIIQRVFKLFANNARKFFLFQQINKIVFSLKKLNKVLPFPHRELFMFSILICSNLKCVIRNLFRSICIFVL
jgi:hypothetical protein